MTRTVATLLLVRERVSSGCGWTPACVRGGPRPAPPTTTRPWWGARGPGAGTSWSRQSSAGLLTKILRPISTILYLTFQKMTLELVIEKFKATGCPLLEHADVSSSQEWIFGAVPQPHIFSHLLTF